MTSDLHPPGINFASAMDEHIALAQRVRSELASSVGRMLEIWARSIANGGKLMFFGNGGSAAQAQHFATELVVRMNDRRAALPAISLSTDTSVITAAANDFGFERVFSRQIEALGRAGDIAVALSTSGSSANVVAALKQARLNGIVPTALVGGDGGEVLKHVDHAILVPSSATQRIQELHLVIGHTLCAGLERLAKPG